jgi:hypothetical protein
MASLPELAAEIAAMRNTTGIDPCPQKTGDCVERLKCGVGCSAARSAHTVFLRDNIPGTTTTQQGGNLLTTGRQGSFQTKDGQVLFQML